MWLEFLLDFSWDGSLMKVLWYVWILLLATYCYHTPHELRVYCLICTYILKFWHCKNSDILLHLRRFGLEWFLVALQFKPWYWPSWPCIATGIKRLRALYYVIAAIFIQYLKQVLNFFSSFFFSFFWVKIAGGESYYACKEVGWNILRLCMGFR